MIGEYDCRKFLTKNLRRLLEGHFVQLPPLLRYLRYQFLWVFLPNTAELPVPLYLN